jgi:hypothetical protein
VVLDTLGLAPTEKMRARAEMLEQIASQVIAPCSNDIDSRRESVRP